jgi:predicted transcriptional regulator of viral defense system
MDFERLLATVGDDPVFESSLLLAGDVDPADVRRQLSRWCTSGRIIQYRRGVYGLAPPYAKERPEPFLVANRIVVPSYVTIQSALAFHGLIPEGVAVVTSVTTRRPGRWDTAFGSFAYRHVQPEWLRGYRRTPLSGRQSALVAVPEKALLDLVYLTPDGDDPDHLRELRLQNLDRIDLYALHRFAEAGRRPKLHRAAAVIADLRSEEMEGYRAL